MKHIMAMLVMGVLVTACGQAYDLDKPTVTVYKSPTCGCCVGWAQHMQQNGFNVEVKEMTNLAPIKEKYGISSDMESCHTAIVDGYVVEGHIPAEEVHLLLDERPDIDGIMLPRMPSGSPGMPGQKRGAWTIYALDDGESSVYKTI